MAVRRFKVNANIPLDKGIHKSFFVEAGSWPVAIGAAARALRRSPELKRRRVTCLSITIEQVSSDTEGSAVSAQTEQAAFPVDNGPESQGQ